MQSRVLEEKRIVCQPFVAEHAVLLLGEWSHGVKCVFVVQMQVLSSRITQAQLEIFYRVCEEIQGAVSPNASLFSQENKPFL